MNLQQLKRSVDQLLTDHPDLAEAKVLDGEGEEFKSVEVATKGYKHAPVKFVVLDSAAVRVG